MIYEFVSYDNPTFLAFSIERVLLRDSENDLQGTYTVKFNEKDWGKYATYKMILPESEVIWTSSPKTICFAYCYR